MTSGRKSSSAGRKAGEVAGKRMSRSALRVANYFLGLQDKEAGDLISNLKIQKLLYYAQGYYVALHGVANPLFADKLYAWEHGPVVKTVYSHFSGYKARPLPVPDQIVRFDEETTVYLDEIYRTYGKFSAWMLRQLSHGESPWKDNYKPNEYDVEIPLQDLRKFFITRVKK